ncbi:GNAT family N-acetyltransferase [Pareuzebyella sediminis]|uniref:GNAT family N-acetyltransferase n=1 Tax=Pareuzebyella sediminis TaxID=2607998 RepID=UPI0011F05464|nr:GNAT family N-acetyltransferase [Pareuzebyella sediminis]
METSVDTIRRIRPEDNPIVASLIREVLVEMGVPKVGTAYADKALDRMYEQYSGPRSVYLVVEDQGKILGCAGIAPLEHYNGNVCELQKMYFHKTIRGRGLGSKMIQSCFEYARKFGFEQVYLETMPFMKAAQRLYVRSGFEYIDARLGHTGHFSCNVWMLKDLI